MQRFSKSKALILWKDFFQPRIGTLISYSEIEQAIRVPGRKPLTQQYVARYIYWLRSYLFSDFHFAVVFNEGYVIVPKKPPKKEG